MRKWIGPKAFEALNVHPSIFFFQYAVRLAIVENGLKYNQSYSGKLWINFMSRVTLLHLCLFNLYVSEPESIEIELMPLN